MITKLFTRSPLHEHDNPAQRVLGAAELPPSSEELARLLVGDPAPAVRVAAAQRCTDLALLAAAWSAETEPDVQAALASSLGRVLAETADGASAASLLGEAHLTDAIRSDVARMTQDAERRRMAISGIGEEEALVTLALGAEHAETRLAAAERVHSPEGLRKLDEAARNKDHGVSRLARQRIEAINKRQVEALEADAILTQLELLAEKAGPILTEVVELNRRWQVLDMSADPVRLARCDAARRGIQARMDREQEEQRSQSRFKAKLREWIEALTPPAEPEAFDVLRAQSAALREEAQVRGDAAALADLDHAGQRIEQWSEERQALAGAEALVIEAEQLAAGTYIDNAKLPERWQALSRDIRTPALTRRFEAALIVVEQRRLAHVQIAQQEASAVRQRVHALLHAGEQALAAGQLRETRVAAEEIRTLKPAAGLLPKPTIKRLGRLQQQLVELERWQSFGQHNARVQLCERAEALATTAEAPRQLALEVQKLRNEWKALDQQYAGVPKALWERFDRACEKAYAPAARHFAEVAAQRKQAREQREQFIAAAAAHAPTLLTEPRDWRAIERWLRETDTAWRESDLGSLEPQTWKKFDTRLKTTLAPLRDALAGARGEAKAARQALIEEATALGTKAMDRDAPSQVKAIQARWQEQAKAMAIPQRDERVLWEQFRAACDAVFKARESKRKEQDGRKSEHRQALEDLCEQLDQLARTTDKSDQEIRRALRDLQDRWRKQSTGSDPALRGVEARFKKATAGVEASLTTRARSRESAVWDTLAAKERLCEELDSRVRPDPGAAEIAAQPAEVQERWSALPALSAAWEKKMLARRDGALVALADAAAAGSYLARIESGSTSRREGLLELELLLSLDSPPEFQSQRLALQVKQLRDRFKSAVTVGVETAGDRLCDWCAQPGIVDARDRERSERVFAAIKLRRH